MSGLLATKLHLPAPPPRLVRRPRLLQRLDDGLAGGHSLTLVSAPAGFGKTTCISEWIHTADEGNEKFFPASIIHHPSSFSWLSLDAADNDPGRFFAYLVAALQKVDMALGQDIASVLRSGQMPPADVLITTLINAISAYSGRFLLVLDDFHLIQGGLILQVIEKLIANPPSTLHLVLITREDPNLPLARLRANNQLTEIRAEDLRFTTEEANRFLTEIMGLCLSDVDISRLEDRTEGWVVGLQLAGLSMRDRADPSNFIANLSGSQRFILGYLTEEVLSRQPEEIQQFLLETSILERMCAELCDAVRENREPRTASGYGSPFSTLGSRDVLDYLDRANLFIVPLDDEQQWYRYHHLFADLLRSRLKQTRPINAIRELHRRASAWLMEKGSIDEAIDHAFQGEDYEAAVSIIEQAARGMMFTGRVNPLRDWLNALPAECVEAHQHLGIYRVWIDLMQGRLDFSEQAMQETDRKLGALPPSPENDALRVELMVILCRFMALLGSSERAIRYAREAMRCLPESDLASRARAQSALAIAYLLDGEIDLARPAYAECIRLAQAAGYYTLAAHTILVMGMGLVPYGQLHEAARSFRSILDMGEASGQKVFFPAGQGYIGLAGVHLEWNDLETAENYLAQGIELCSQAGLDGVYTGYSLKARLCQARGDFAGALEIIHTIEQKFQRKDPSIACRSIQIRLAMGDVDEAARLAVPIMDLIAGAPGATRMPLVVRETTIATLVRVHIARGEFERAFNLADSLQSTAGSGARNGHLIEVYLLRAMACQKRDGGAISPAARECFEHALDLAEPEGYVLLFIEAGIAARSLILDYLYRAGRGSNQRLRTYATRLLQSFRPMEAPSTSGWQANIQDRLDPLTDRELDVLRLMADGLKYEEIADRLYISLNTVRTYVKGIYSKLGADNRTKAIAIARNQNLIS